jgi:hypothetical protein
MATATIELVEALRTTAVRLQRGVRYQWGHCGECNCGHLAQTVTGLGRGQIHAWAMERQAADWEDLGNDYCPASGHRIDDVIAALVGIGLAPRDLGHLEQLDDPAVLRQVPPERQPLRRNQRDDVVAYLEAWAGLLEAQLPAPIPLAAARAA